MHRIGMKRILFVFLLFLGFAFANIPMNLQAAEDEAQIQESTQADEGAVLQPREPSSRLFERKSSDTGLVWAIYLFLLMLAVMLGLWVYSRKGGLNLKKGGFSNELKIRETKPLGNRQFLVVVEYGQQKMLIGVAPGVINHLCYLEDVSVEEDQKVEA